MPGYEHFGDEERKEVNDVLETGILMRYGFDGPRKGIWKAKELEAAVRETFGCDYAQLVSSGTTALVAAMQALGIGYGDEVIMPCFTFVASFEAIIGVGAVPVLVDVDDTLTLNPESVRRAITPKTKCIMPVHMCGSMADLGALLAICKEHHLLLIEDACQAIGGTYQGKKLGTLGDAGTFSFDFVKTITCAEGGVVMTNRKDVYVAVDGYSDHGHDHLGVDRGADLHPFIGNNFRISELHAAVGLAQIRKLDGFLEIQRRNHGILKNLLSEIPEISFRRVPDEAGDSCTFLNWFLPNEAIAKAVVNAWKEQGTLAGNFYWFANNWHYIRQWAHLKEASTLSHLHPDMKTAIMAQANKDFSASDAIMSRCISTAISLQWTEEQVIAKGRQMVASIQQVLAEQTVVA